MLPTRTMLGVVGPILLGWLSPFTLAQTQQVTVNNATLHYRDEGVGETIVFVHGLQEDYRIFEPQVALLSGDYRVIAYSRRYNYPNANAYEVGGVFSARTEAEDLAAFIRQLDAGPVHLVGHSYGGLIAALLIEKYPDLVKTLTLSEPALVDWLPDIPACQSWYDSVQVNLIEAVRAGFEQQDTTEILHNLFLFFVGEDVQAQLPPEVRQFLIGNLTEVQALVYADDPFPPVRKEILTTLKKPVLLLSAGHTLPLIRCVNTELKALLPEARHYHLPDATHDYWMSHPDQLGNYLRDFLESSESGVE